MTHMPEGLMLGAEPPFPAALLKDPGSSLEEGTVLGRNLPGVYTPPGS